MKKSLLFKTVILMILFAGLSSATWAQVLYEDFNYATPAFVGGNGAAASTSNNWITHSVTSGQVTTIDIQDGSLTYTGLAGSTGNKVYVPGTNSTVSRDINRAFTSTTDAVMYYSALIRVIDNTQLNTNGDYFMSFAATSGGSAASLGGRLGIKSVNGGANFKLCIQNTSSPTGGPTVTFTEFPLDLTFGTTYLVVVKYDRTAIPTIASLWVNPTSLGGLEPTGSVSNNIGTSIVSAFAAIGIRNGSGTPKANIDEIRVGATWASVTPPVPTITVTAPVTGAQWEQGTTRNVTWTALATNTNVKIEFTPNASATPVVWSTINKTDVVAASAGTYAIPVPVGDANVPVSADCQFRISDISETAFGLSGIFSVIAPQPPVATFTPANGATAVDITSNITIAYDVPVRNIDNSEITDAQLASLVTLKTTDAAGTAVPFTATGDPLTRTITINPDADLLNSQVYYVAVAPVEGYNDVATVAQHVTFTTVQSLAPAISAVTVTETGPFFAGDAVHVNWVSANVATVKIELIETATSTVTSVATAVTAATGTASIVLPATLAYSAAYAVRVTDEATVTNSESSTFTVIAVANSLLALRAQPVDAIVKYTGVATVTYARTSRNQKYIQDATAAILIDDPTTAPGFITGTYAIGDGITNIIGKIFNYSGLIEFLLDRPTGETATGTAIVPEVRTLASLTPADQCKLVKIENFAFKTPTQYDLTGLFVKSKNYDIDATDNTLLAFRTAFTEANYIGSGQYVPVGTISSIALVGQYTSGGVTQMQITARSWADMGMTVDVDKVVSEKMQLSISPNPGNGDVTVTLPSKGTFDLKVYSLTGKLVHTSSMSGLSGKLDLSFLPKGLYILNASNILTGKVSSSRLVIN